MGHSSIIRLSIIYTFYNTQTKIVYRVKAVIDDVAENIAEQHIDS